MTCPPCPPKQSKPPKVDWQCRRATEKVVQYEGDAMSFCLDSLIPSSSNQTSMSTSSTDSPSNPLVPTTLTGHIDPPGQATHTPPQPTCLIPLLQLLNSTFCWCMPPNNPNSMLFNLEKFFSDTLWDYYAGSPAVFPDPMLSPIPAPSPIALGSGPPFPLASASTSEELRDPAYVVPLYMVF